MSFARNLAINIGKILRKNSSSKHNQKLLDHAKQSITDALKTVLKWAIQKTGDLIGS